MTPRGIAFDTNLLGKPLTRRLMLLWMELSDLAVVVLPAVKDELLFKRPNPTEDERLMDGLFENVWLETWAKPRSPYEHVTLDAEQNERAKDTLRSFTLRCFPKAPSKEAIARLPDARVLAEAVAVQVDMVVTNNMASIDHTEVNALVRAIAASNENILTNADDALLHSHVGAEGSRHLLTMFLAATWPDQGLRSMSMSDCREHLAACTQGLATGAAMPNCASKLNNAFVVDERLDNLIADAQALAQGSRNLAIDNEHALTVKRKLAQLRLARPPLSAIHSVDVHEEEAMTAERRKELVVRILAELRKCKTRMSYGAVGCLLGGLPPVGVGRRLLGCPRPEASWVVRKDDGKPTGYKECQCHPDLYAKPDVLESCCKLRNILKIPPPTKHSKWCEGGC